MTSHVPNDGPRMLDRRRVVRTAATLAWTVPAIQVATAVPAFAASGCCHVSVANGTPHWRDGGLNYIDIPLDLNNGCNTPVTGLTVMLTICGIKDITYSGDPLPSGWTQLGKPNQKLDPDGGGCYTVTYTTGQSLAGNGVLHPTFTVKSQAYVGSGHNRPAGTVTAVVSTTGCTSDPMVFNIPKVS